MKVTKASGQILVGFVVSSFLLVLTVNCTFEQQAQEDYYKESSESFMANPFCLVCHADFEGEQLALNHKLAGIGCERCHGESERHRSDEANVTPPEIMYPQAKINPTCMMCHPRHDIQHVKDHEPLLAGAKTIFDEEPEATAAGEKKYCTDCHGTKHRMKVRTVRWNKATGELIEAE
ncbi:MAG: multiheme c-type cytochrome [Sedimentisphaerales bacterium]